jgi:hypothetical protein
MYFKYSSLKAIGCSFKFLLKVGVEVEESIVNAPRLTLRRNLNERPILLLRTNINLKYLNILHIVKTVVGTFITSSN